MPEPIHSIDDSQTGTRAVRTAAAAAACSGLCSGCGVCAGVCPSQAVAMRFEGGAYMPAVNGKCRRPCGLCMAVCPFAEQPPGADARAGGDGLADPAVQSDPLLGRHLECFLGHSMTGEHRRQGASGGMVTWMIEELLREGRVDGAVCVVPGNRQDGALFEFRILRNVEEVRAAASTKYYPVQAAGVLETILAGGGDRRYAFVGLPCLLTALRRAMRLRPALGRRIPYLLGLVCGRCPTAFYTEALAVMAGVSPDNVAAAGYRFKDGVRQGWFYRFRAQDRSGAWSRPVGFERAYPLLWERSYFALKVCDFCDDVFAEAADAVFMDAWLPALLSETRGSSIVVARHAALRDLLAAGARAGRCQLEPLPAAEVIRSQRGCIARKRIHLPERVAVARELGQPLPALRATATVATAIDLRMRRQITIEARTAVLSQRWWPRFRPFHRLGLWPFVLAVDAAAGGGVYALRSAARFLWSRVRARGLRRQEGTAGA